MDDRSSERPSAQANDCLYDGAIDRASDRANDGAFDRAFDQSIDGAIDQSIDGAGYYLVFGMLLEMLVVICNVL